MELKNKQVLVVGTGKSGIAATNLLSSVGAIVTIFDNNETLDVEKRKTKLISNTHVDVVLGKMTEELMSKIELVVLSPGVPTDLDYIINMREKGIPIWGEIELAYQCGKGEIVAITGTNGKTTTTALVGSIMKLYYESSFVVGNIGIPYTEVTLDTEDESVIVAEISSFQLETIENFCPHVSAILNITPDHLNRHHTMENYIKAKVDITKNQTAKDICVLNFEDEVLRKASTKMDCKVVFVSSKRSLEEGIYLEGEEIIYVDSKEKVVVCNIHDLKLLGIHNYENVMAGIAIAMNMNVPIEIIRKAITEFRAVEHRIEYVDEVNGVKYYNDSKGTNPDAAIKAIEAMVTPTLLIGGGYDKDSSYEEWIQSFNGKVKYLVLLGQTKEKIAETALKLGFDHIIMVSSLEEAVNECAKRAVPGDSVLLSPACASWGMFQNYEERGDMFKQYVRELM